MLLYFFGLVLAFVFSQPTCDSSLSSDVSCYYESSASTMWVGVKYSAKGTYNCQNACRAALCHTGTFYRHDVQRSMSKTDFVNNIISNLAGIECDGSLSWSPIARLRGSFVFQDNISDSGTRPWKCAVPSEVVSGAFREKGPPALASVICPCVAAASLEEACPWSDRSSAIMDDTITYAKFDDPSQSPCLREINRRRKQACDEGWAICPPCGLPPMVECRGCHECATSVAKASFENGPHSGGGRCKNRAAGESYAASRCNDTIAGLIGNELVDLDLDGKYDQCTGHCGPFYRAGCESFSYGKWETTATFLFGSVYSASGTENCPGENCQAYCDANPSDSGCAPSQFAADPATGSPPGFPTSTNSGVVSGVTLVSFALVLFLYFLL